MSETLRPVLRAPGLPFTPLKPNPLCFGILSRRFRYTSNVKCFQQGVMDRPCTLTLSTPTAHEQWDEIDTTVGASFVFPETKEVTSTDVECIDLAAFISRLPHVRLLKLDIEGSEIPVINHLMETGAIDKIDLTVVETHEPFPPNLRPVPLGCARRSQPQAWKAVSASIGCDCENALRGLMQEHRRHSPPDRDRRFS